MPNRPIKYPPDSHHKPAKIFRFKDLGLVKEKYMADLVVLDKNPPEDLEHFKSVHAVIKSGNFIGQNEIQTGLKNIRNHHMNPKKEVEPDENLQRSSF